MFRTDENQKKYGIGTIVKGLHDKQWVLIGGKSNNLYVVCMTTWVIESSMVVVNPDWITRKEFDSLMNFTRCTLTDFVLYARGEM